MKSTLFALAAAAGIAQAAEPIAYPEEYRDWTHVKSMVIYDDHPLADPFKGIHHIYANDAAQAGLASGDYADGAAFAFDQLAFVTDAGASTEGDRVLIGLMVKDRARFPDTGGWGFEGWRGDSRDERLVSDGGAGCFGCHTQVQEQDYVFTQWRN
ncbi:MAG: cytochrome P460 family protein [Thiohalocapsa sp.]|jgi:hypothetical protein|nr:cytochrome P460 family protein [Thiohalocapsa sp.]MCF7989536.1 cytochrome P460 family protein [Thiohalocapsa sp.]